MPANEIPTSVINLGIIETTDPIGFSLVPDQIRLKSMLEGFQLNLLVVGRRGLGTRTLINSLFAVPVIDKERTNNFTTSKNEIFENDIRLKTVITTYHGNDSSLILKYLERKNMDYFENEWGLKSNFPDKRVYACLYILPLDEIRPEEIETMKLISIKCNLIPIIPKADIFTPEELIEQKSKMNNLFREHDINVYLPTIKYEPDFECEEDIKEVCERYPLAVIASETSYEHKGESFRGRKYRWGFIDVDNKELSDLFTLRKILIDTFLDDLIHQTNTKFYEEFRTKCISDEELISRLDEDLVRHLKLEIEKVYEEKKIKHLKLPEQRAVSENLTCSNESIEDMVHTH